MFICLKFEYQEYNKNNISMKNVFQVINVMLIFEMFF